MTKTATVRARIEPSVKRKTETILRRIGLSPSEAITIFYRQVALQGGLPFSAHIPNALTAKTIRDARNGIGLHAPEPYDVWKKRMLKHAKSRSHTSGAMIGS